MAPGLLDGTADTMAVAALTDHVSGAPEIAGSSVAGSAPAGIDALFAAVFAAFFGETEPVPGAPPESTSDPTPTGGAREPATLAAAAAAGAIMAGVAAAGRTADGGATPTVSSAAGSSTPCAAPTIASDDHAKGDTNRPVAIATHLETPTITNAGGLTPASKPPPPPVTQAKPEPPAEIDDEPGPAANASPPPATVHAACVAGAREPLAQDASTPTTAPAAPSEQAVGTTKSDGAATRSADAPSPASAADAIVAASRPTRHQQGESRPSGDDTTGPKGREDHLATPTRVEPAPLPAPAAPTTSATAPHEVVHVDAPAVRSEAPATHDVERLLGLQESRRLVARDGGEMRLELTPDGLGRIEVHVAVRADAVHATLYAAQDQARETLTAHREALAAALGRSNLRLEGFTVGLGHDRRQQEGRDEATMARPSAPSPTTHAPEPMTGLEAATTVRGVSLRA